MQEAAELNTKRNSRLSRLSLIVMGAGVASLVAAVTLFVLTLTGALGTNGYSGPGTITGPIKDIRDVLTPQPTATPDLPPPSDAPIARIAIPRFEVDAPVVVRSVDAEGVMQTPDGPEDVAWYDFSAKPGYGSNAVFSGHVDYINYGPAVFWNLKDLELDDAVEVRLVDGTVYTYRVVAKEQVYAATANIGEIVGGTPRDIVTLITCGGSWDGQQYDQRVIVRAARTLDAAPAVGSAPSP